MIHKNSDLGRSSFDLVLKLLPWDFLSPIYITREFQVIWSFIPSGMSFIGVPTIQEGATPLRDSIVGGVALGRWA